MISAQLEAAQRQLRVVQQQAHDHSIEMSSRLASEQACRASTEAGMAAAEQERLRSGAEAQSAKIKLEEGMQANRGQQTQLDLSQQDIFALHTQLDAQNRQLAAERREFQEVRAAFASGAHARTVPSGLSHTGSPIRPERGRSGIGASPALSSPQQFNVGSPRLGARSTSPKGAAKLDKSFASGQPPTQPPSVTSDDFGVPSATGTWETRVGDQPPLASFGQGAGPRAPGRVQPGAAAPPLRAPGGAVRQVSILFRDPTLLHTSGERVDFRLKVIRLLTTTLTSCGRCLKARGPSFALLTWRGSECAISRERLLVTSN